MMDAAKKLMKEIGTDIYMDFNKFLDAVADAAKELKLDVKTNVLNAIARTMSESDPKAATVIKKEHKANSKDIEALKDLYGVDDSKLADYGYMPAGKKGFVEYETDSELRDTEKIPVKDDIYDYFMREVRPYVDDAWINLPPTKIGCEISFNKYFYKPTPLRSLKENEKDILELDKQSQGFIRSLFK
jgi:type I restriction enzyme M protein